MFTRIWLTPPLAFGRLGSAGRPMQNFSWAPNVIAPGRKPTTRLQAEETLTLDDDGVVSAKPASQFNQIEFKDGSGRFFPVCPFFELHGEWDDAGKKRSGPISETLLSLHGPNVDGRPFSLADVEWTIVVGNLKAHHYTLADSDRLEARVVIAGNHTRRVALAGSTPSHVGGVEVAGERMVAPQTPISLGEIQIAKPSKDFPELRIRIYPPAGLVYGTADLSSRPLSGEWQGFRLPRREIVNPLSAWAKLRLNEIQQPPLQGADSRNNPGGLAALDDDGVSLGLVDDVSDGIVICRVGELVAHARIAIGPPDFAPNARPIVSLQDGLADREDRASVRAGQFTLVELEALVHDIFERALEASDLMNKDAQSDRAHRENGEQRLPPPPNGFQDRAIGTLWPRAAPISANNPAPNNVDTLPVTAEGQRKHRRLNALEYLKDRLREEPGFLDTWLRPPVDPSSAYDRRMPPLMRNSDRYPIHLTRRQFEIVHAWVAKLAEVGQ